MKGEFLLFSSFSPQFQLISQSCSKSFVRHLINPFRHTHTHIYPPTHMHTELYVCVSAHGQACAHMSQYAVWLRVRPGNKDRQGEMEKLWEVCGWIFTVQTRYSPPSCMYALLKIQTACCFCLISHAPSFWLGQHLAARLFWLRAYCKHHIKASAAHCLASLAFATFQPSR